MRKQFVVQCFCMFLLTQGVAANAQDTVVVKEQTLDEVVVKAHVPSRRLEDVKAGAEVLDLDRMKHMPALFGERDIMRSVQMLPGVKAESDASSSFQVRGGTAAQNAILYDDAPVYNVGHLAGLFSAFNDNALASATLYKGLVPAQFGGASASVMDMTARAGDRQKWHGMAGIGLLAAKASAEGPVMKDKLSLAINARTSYMGMLLKLSDDFNDNTLYFYDINAKLDYLPNERDRIFLTLFAGRDRVSVGDMVDMGWSNLAASIHWQHRFGNGAHSHTTAFYSGYGNDNGIDLLGLNQSFTGHIRQSSLRQNFHIPLGNHAMDAGLQTTLADVKSAEWQKMNTHETERRKAWDNNVWLDGIFRLAGHVTFSAGMRVNAFSPLGGSLYYNLDESGDIIRLFDYGSREIVKTYVTLEPRLGVMWHPVRLLSVKAGYSRMSQNIHALRNQSTSTPFDRYALSSNIVKPEVAGQLTAGVYAMTPSQGYDLSVEAYYRTVDNVVDYRDGKSFSSEIEIERLILPGEGRGYGMEFCIRKNTGRLTGWLAYTLSWSESRINGINEGRWYAAGNDRRHDIDLMAIYRLTSRWTLNAAWVYNSGQAFTAPSGKYEMEDNWIYYYAERNGYRAPAYHRLDIGATWAMKTPKTGTTRELAISLYNVYNHYNPFLINFEDSQDGSRTRAVQYSLFGIVPSVSFTVKF